MTIYKQQDIGRCAEREACDYLQAQGLRLVEQNYTCYHGEIDLIMQDQEDIVFVEVRRRGRVDYGNAIESITKTKMNKLIKTAKHFLQAKKWLDKVSSRFDVIAIHPIQGKMQLEWIKNAFWVDIQ